MKPPRQLVNRDERMRANGRIPPPFGSRPRKFPRSRDRLAAFASLDRRVGSPDLMSARLAVESLAARAASKLSRIAGAGGGTTLPGKLLWKLDPGAIDALAARLPDGAAVVSATNGKTTTTAMAAEILEPRPPARLEPLGREPRLRRRVHPPRRSATPSSACSRSTRGRCRRSSAACGRGRCCSAISSATSSTATASWSTSPSAGVRRRPRCRAETVLVVNGDDPQVGDLARERPNAIAYGIDDPTTRPAGAPARGRLALLRPLRAAVRVRRRLRRPPRRLPLPRLRPRAARAAGACDARSSSTGCTPPRSCSRRQPGSTRAPAAAPWPLQRLQRPRSRRTRAGARRVARGDPGRARALRRRLRPLRADPGGRQDGARAADQEPRRRERGRAHAARGRRARRSCSSR